MGKQYNPEDYPKNLNQVNAFLKQNGAKFKALANNKEGYYYWENLAAPSVYVYRAEQLSFGRWLEEYKDAEKY